MSPGEVIDGLPSVFIRPVAVPVDTIERELVRGRYIGNDAGFNKSRGWVSAVRFERFCGK